MILTVSSNSIIDITGDVATLDVGEGHRVPTARKRICAMRSIVLS